MFYRDLEDGWQSENGNKASRIVSQINQKMRSLQVKIEDLNKWRSIQKNGPNILPVVKSYDISLHTLATTECQELASRFEERARQILAGIMDLYEKSIYDIHRYIQWIEINFEYEHPVPFPFF